MKTWVLLLAVTAVGCGGEDGPGCDLDVRSGSVEASFDDGALDALIEATGRFHAEVTGLDGQLRTACNDISSRLGGASGATTQAACDNAGAAIESKLAANPGVQILVSVTPAVCSVEASAVIDCVGECDASFDATVTPPTCEGGELSGGCSGQCSGSCEIEGDVTCEGSCTGTCEGSCTGTIEGSCTGTCTGQCEGTCSATAADGSCAGTCSGTCTGTCSGTVSGSCNAACSGSCEGSCRSTVSGSCEGSCAGSCDVMFTEPRCEGGHFDVEADADCEAACESEASFEVECDDPQVVVTFSGAAAAAADVEAVIGAIEANYPALAEVIVRLPIIADATADLAGRVSAAVDSAIDVGAQGVLCLTEAAAAAAEAASIVTVDVQISVEVQGSVMAGN